MPTYQLNVPQNLMRSTGEGLSELVKVFSGGNAGEAALRRAQTEAAYADAEFTRARIGIDTEHNAARIAALEANAEAERARGNLYGAQALEAEAETLRIKQETAGAADLGAVLSKGGHWADILPDAAGAAARAGTLDEFDPGALAPLYGAGVEDLEPLVYGRDGDFAKTREGQGRTLDNNLDLERVRNEGAFAREEAARNAELIELYSPEDGTTRLVPRSGLGGAPAGAPMPSRAVAPDGIGMNMLPSASASSPGLADVLADAPMAPGNMEDARLRWETEQANDQARWETLNQPLTLGEGQVVFPSPEDPRFVAPDAPLAGNMSLNPDERIITPGGAEITGPTFEPDPNGALGYEGDAMEAQHLRIIESVNRVVRERGAGALSADDEFQYRQALSSLYGPKRQDIETPDGRKVVDIPPQPVPPGVWVPPDMQGFLQTGAAAVPGAPAVAGAPAVPGAPAVAGADGIIPGTEPEGGPDTESQSRYFIYAERIKVGADGLMKLIGYDPVTGIVNPNGFRPNLVTDVVNEQVPPALRGYAQGEDTQLFYTYAAQTLNPLIRADSGAAVPDSEYPRYYDQYIPLPGQTDSVVKAKMTLLQVTLLAYEIVSGQLGYEAGMAKEADLPMVNRLMQQTKAEIQREMAGGAPGAPGAPGADPNGLPPGFVPYNP